MSNNLELGDLTITVKTFEDEPISAKFELPNGSIVTRNFPESGELTMKLGLGLGLTHIRASSSAPEPLSISGTPVLSATEGEAYAGFTATASGGEEPYTYSLVGTWPAGITVNSSTGEVSGTPTESGTFASLSVRVTDVNLDTADLDTFTLEVEMSGAAPSYSQLISRTANPGAGLAHTFTGESIGTAASNRYLIAGVSLQNSADVRSVSGIVVTPNAGSPVSLTRIATIADAGKDTVVELWGGLVPEGTTADIEITASAATARFIMALAAAYSLTGITPFHTARTEVQGATVSVNYPANGLVIAASSRRNSSATISITGTGMTSDVTNLDSGVNHRMGYGHGIFVSSGSVTVDGGDQGGASGGLVAASFEFTGAP